MKKTYPLNDEYLKKRFSRGNAVAVGARVAAEKKRMRVVIRKRWDAKHIICVCAAAAPSVIGTIWPYSRQRARSSAWVDGRSQAHERVVRQFVFHKFILWLDIKLCMQGWLSQVNWWIHVACTTFADVLRFSPELLVVGTVSVGRTLGFI